jgi:hypothetical protein
VSKKCEEDNMVASFREGKLISDPLVFVDDRPAPALCLFLYNFCCRARNTKMWTLTQVGCEWKRPWPVQGIISTFSCSK